MSARQHSILLSAAVLIIAPATGVTAAEPEPGQVTGLIVQYDDSVPAVDRAGEPMGASRVPGVELTQSRRIGFGMRAVTFNRGLSAESARAAAARYASLPGVVSAEPDYPVHTLATTTQPGATWGLDRIDQRTLPLSSTYTYDSTGQGVKAYIVDTGILASHSQFKGRVAGGYSVISDGYGTSDRNGHGTHVAGTVGGSTYGVAKAVSLVPVRVLNSSGSGTTSGVISGLNWIVSDHAAGVPAVANMSLGGAASSSLDSAVNAVIADGVTMVVAAGNSNADACLSSPARVPAAITVNASTSADIRATFSNYGPCSDLYAPGVNITSAWYTSTTATSTISGTSMASPHVAGVAARLLSSHPAWTPAQVWGGIDTSSTSVPFGLGGRGDPDKLVYVGVEPATTPGAPTAVTAKRADRSATVAWTAPAASGGTAISGYTARAWSTSNAGTLVGSCSATTSPCTITGLVNATTYYVDVVAANSSGIGPASAPRVAVTPATVPAAPAQVTVSGSAKSITVKWAKPSSNGGAAITGYRASVWSVSSGGTAPVATCTTTSTKCTVRSLKARSRYYVDVVAINAVGTSNPSTPRVAISL